jgi:phosphatidylinositol glycan class B
MNRATLRTLLGAVFFLGVLARIWAWRTQDALHYDEYFQVLEPPHWRLTGAGMLTWEWNDGVRSWVLPGYHGAWMALLRACGVRDGATIGRLLQLHWAIVNAVIVFVAFHGAAGISRRMSSSTAVRVPAVQLVSGERDAPGRRRLLGARAEAGWAAGLLAALLCALFPQLFLFAPHTLSESPAMLCFVAALVLVADVDRIGDGPMTMTSGRVRGRVLLSGGLFSLGVCLKVAWAPLALMGPAVLLVRRRAPLMGWMIVGALPPVLLFGLVDLLTWGSFLGSFVKYLVFNFIEGKAAQFGVEPWHWYLKTLHERLPYALPLLLVPAFAGWRATWPYLVSAFGLLAQLSTQGHKEERFVILIWPLVLIAAAGVVGGWLARRGRWSTFAAAVAGTGALLVDAGTHAATRGIFERAWLDAQATAARDPDAIALMMDSSANTGGLLWFSGRGPLFGYDEALLNNEMITHVVVRRASDREQRVREAGFVRVGEWGKVVLLKRR